MNVIINANGVGEKSDSLEGFFNIAILVTGATDFVRKCIPEKLMRICPHVAAIFILIRPKRSQTSQQRFRKLLDDPCLVNRDCSYLISDYLLLPNLFSSFISTSAPLILKTDASNLAIGAALEQFEDNKSKLIGSFSRRLSKAEHTYPNSRRKEFVNDTSNDRLCQNQRYSTTFETNRYAGSVT
ncbi:unnamed protein product [Heterotrigona itama]|uniref:Fatty acyl-CoA reductase n=1 Tax=Heterotrigona itama TaxID=395501 RepID=A0A6V7H138_9HYME|nr:unnamed protein product [Heterotrigona itama]